MIAQDTGSAIVGPARADLYWGAGNLAGQIAGRIKQPGRFTMLVPREIDPVEAGARMPLPLSRPVNLIARQPQKKIGPAHTAEQAAAAKGDAKADPKVDAKPDAKSDPKSDPKADTKLKHKP
jgi:membrane-bound lytic murein transglycosylase A